MGCLLSIKVVSRPGGASIIRPLLPQKRRWHYKYESGTTVRCSLRFFLGKLKAAKKNKHEPHIIMPIEVFLKKK